MRPVRLHLPIINLARRSMKAIVYTQYGPPEVLHLSRLEKPQPKANEVLIKVRACTVTSADCRVRSLTVPTGFQFIMRLVFGLTRPRRQILGTELAGVVESVGSGVTSFQSGDAVFAFSDAAMGCYAEYVCLPESGAMALKPEVLSFEEAACLSFGGTTALHFLRKAKLQSGQSVLVNGASGCVGSAAVQLAKHLGAEVTGVCSKRNGELVRCLGADHVIDYTQEDFANNGKTYDVIIDTVGVATYSHCKQALTPTGCLLLVAADLPAMLQALWISIFGSQKIIVGTAIGKAEDLQFLAKLAEAGLYKPTIDQRYPFDQMAKAHRYVDTGRKVGNVVVVLDHEE